MTREEFYKLTDILNSEVLGNFMHGGEADELIAMFEEAVEHSNILEQEEPVSEDFEKIVEEIAEPTILNAYGTKELARRLRNTICDTSVSDDLEEASMEWLNPQLDKSYEPYGKIKQLNLTRFDGYAMLDAIEFGVNWQKQLMMKNAVECDVIRKDDGLADLRWKDENGLKKLTSNLNNGDKVKIITVKNESKV